MILGLGLDVVEVARIQRILAGPPARAERFLARFPASSYRERVERQRDRARAER